MNNVDIGKYIGVPFKTHGRSVEEGFDCYGYTIALYKDLGRELPDFEYKKSDTETVSDNYVNVLKELGNKVVKSDRSAYGDLILFFDSRQRATHIGMALGPDTFTHCDKFGVRVLRFDVYNRKYEVYKWQQ